MEGLRPRLLRTALAAAKQATTIAIAGATEPAGAAGIARITTSALVALGALHP